MTDPANSPTGEPRRGEDELSAPADQTRSSHRTALYERLHSHPALAVATKVVVTLIGGLVLLVGVIMLVTPGPAFVMIPLGLAILATEWQWAHRLLVHAREAAARARERAMAVEPGTRRRRLLAAGVAVVCVVAAGVALALELELAPGM